MAVARLPGTRVGGLEMLQCSSGHCGKGGCCASCFTRELGPGTPACALEQGVAHVEAAVSERKDGHLINLGQTVQNQS